MTAEAVPVTVSIPDAVIVPLVLANLMVLIFAAV